MSKPTRFEMGQPRQCAVLPARPNRDGSWAVCESCGERLVRVGAVNLAAYVEAVVRDGAAPRGTEAALAALFVGGVVFGELVGWQPASDPARRPIHYRLSNHARRREATDRAVARDTTGAFSADSVRRAKARLSAKKGRRDRRPMGWMPEELRGHWSRRPYVGDVLECPAKNCGRPNRLDETVAAEALVRQVAAIAASNPARLASVLAAGPPDATDLVRATIDAAQRPQTRPVG